jgi:integrase
MSDKIDHGGGIYSRVCKRAPGGKPLEVFYGRVFFKAEGRSRYFRLGTALKAAQKRMHTILGDPEAALKEREARSKPAPKRLSVGELIDAFLAGYTPRGDSGFYGHASESWREHFGDVDAATVTRAMVEDYRDALARDGASASTIRSYLTALGTCYRWAKVRGLLPDNPALDWRVKGEGVTRPPKPDREVDVLSRDEEKTLLAAADPAARIMIRLFIESGMRQGGRGDGEEGLNLKWPQVDRAGGAILIPKSKTGRARAIPLNARLTAVLDGATRHVRSEFLLCDREGNRLDPWRATRAVESAMERAGIVKVGGPFNLMRHTFGSRLAEQGVSFGAIAKIMGNSAAVCERHYIRFSPGYLKAAMATLDRARTVAPRGARAPRERFSGSSKRLQVVAGQ